MWLCDRCGKEISEEYEVCMYCGNIRAHEPPEINTRKIEPVVQTETHVPEMPRQPEKPPKRKKTALICAAVFAAVLLFFGVNFIFHSTAKSCYAKEDYLGAVKNAERDMFFSKELLVEARRELGRAYMYQAKHTEARDTLDAIEDERVRAEALYELAEYQMDKELYAEARTTYLLLGEAEAAVRGRNMALLMEAWDYMLEGDYEPAEGCLRQMDEGMYEELEGAVVQNEINFRRGTDALKEGRYSDGVSWFEKCIDHGSTAQTLEAAICLSEGKAYEAALLAKGNMGYDYGQISDYYWTEIFLNYRNNVKPDDVEQRMTAGAAAAVLAGNRTAIADNNPDSIQYCFSLGNIPSGVESAMGGENITLVDKSIMLEGGSAPDGKVLILWQVHNYVTKLTDYAIAWDVMEYLPAELYPQSLASVEYVIRISYDYQGDGWYSIEGMGNVSALKEYCKVVAELAGSRRQLYAANTVWGPEAPGYIFSWDVVDGYVSGGDPDKLGVANAVLSAINAAIK